ncbi:SPL family radical SAM protein [Paenibacillus tyrfis]|uniref:SPL family radical SAM protein n=1 Tax=Paenibacillus tyrfis TaxID=1501230 RepID=UPI0020A00918|nr:radical SAM protein [Paenibacillus tyrfis]MCP1309318.1 radical SAM protein [Paenibacillus tyrfis]
MPTQTRYEPVRAKQLLNPVKAPSMPFDWSINPYRGCQHGCSFCYARSTHAFLGMEADDTFQHHILYKDNAPEALQAQVERMLRAKGGRSRLGRIAIGTATDPYQPLEGRLTLTRQCLEVLVTYRLPVSITTRSPLILRDIDLLRKLPGSSVNISLNTLDKRIWRSFEPMSPAPAQRLKALQGLRQEGIEAGIFMAPILPFLTDQLEEMEQVVEQAAEAKACFVMGSVLRLNTSEVKSWFFGTIRQAYPRLVGSYADWYGHSPTAPKAYREQIRTQLARLLERYSLPEYLPVIETKPTQAESPEDDKPVQLAFALDL